MPIYEFKCKECGEIFEELILGKVEKNIICKKCESKEVEKLMSTVAFKCEGSFRGSKGSVCASCKGGKLQLLWVKANGLQVASAI